jgi:hypothetical protein
LDLNSWEWHLVSSGKESANTDPFSADTLDYDDENWTNKWRVAIPDTSDRLWYWVFRIAPDFYPNSGMAIDVWDTATEAIVGQIWSEGVAFPYPSKSGLIWCVDYGDNEDQIVIKAYDPRVRPVPYWLWAVTAGCVASVAVAATWGRGRRK